MNAVLSVVALDLTTGREVHVNDAPLRHWYNKGHSGDHTLTCVDCHEQGLAVALVVKGKLHGQRRPHFAHPPYTAPAGGHSRESAWHAESKQRLAQWARHQSNVASAIVEHSTADRRRRSDVSVQLHDGTRLALEVQYSDLPDAIWLRRHEDYQAAGVIDIWFWPANHAPHRILLAHGRVPWIFDLDTNRVGIPLANGPALDGQWWLEPAAHLAPHHPPCPEDDVRIHPVALDRCALGFTGLLIPEQLAAELAELTRAAQWDIGRIRAAQQHHEQLQGQLRAVKKRIDTHSLKLTKRAVAASLTA